ncbi:MAG: hypothetical protein AAFY19_03240 [Pseudomonadota bacterium]
MNEVLRQIHPIEMPGVTPAGLQTLPELKWLPIEALVINGAYQRDLSDKSVRSIRRIVGNFDWSRFKALSVLDRGDGTYEVVDGQHSAIAAASHPDISEVPCLVSQQRADADSAANFVAINRDRVAMTPIALFFAELAAKDEIALEVLQGVESAGGRICRQPPPNGAFKPGDTMAIQTLKSLAKKGGPAWVKRAMSICIQAKVLPVKTQFLKAMELLVWSGEWAGDITDEEIVSVIRIHSANELLRRAQQLRAETRQPIGRCLATVIARLR